MNDYLRAISLAALFCLALFGASRTIAESESDRAFKLPRAEVSESLEIPRHFVQVKGEKMAYLELGDSKNDTVLFIHGNPTSSYLWRNVMPHVAQHYHAVAPDLIGMGYSGKPEISYDFADHYAYLSDFIKTLGKRKLILVGHDWGAALAWEYARQNPSKVKALAFMEGVLPPAFPVPSYEAMGEDMGGMFRAFNDPEMGKQMIIENHMFVEQVLPGFVNRNMGSEAMSAYRAPFIDKESRQPILAWPRQIPIAGSPPDTEQVLNDIGKFMSKTKMPVLLTYARPGVLVNKEAVDYYISTIPNLETVYVGQGLHFIQEDQPDAIGLALSDWLRRQ
jgi:haloalkane dehalogenase